MLSYKIVATLLLLLSLLQALLCAQQTPVDHLLPPPPPLLPTPQPLKHQKAPTYTSSADTVTAAAASTYSADDAERPGFMTRIARWFGLGPPEQQLTAVTPHKQYADDKTAYSYAQGKAPCNLCNKYPWVPMLHMGLQYPPAKAYVPQFYGQAASQPQFDAQASQKHPQRQPLQSYTTSTSQQLPVKQRAVQFNFPALAYNFQQQNLQHQSHTPTHEKFVTPLSSARPSASNAPRPAVPYVPVPVPNLSLSALPPIYNAQPFRPTVGFPPIQSSSTATTSTEQSQFSEQQLPSTEPAHFAENIGAHSELQPSRAYPTQAQVRPPSQESNFEIFKSHQLTDFVSSVEYPITYEQSPSIDLGQQSQVQPVVPSNHKPANESIATVNYQYQTFSPHLNSHIPASQILTELGSFGEAQQQVKQQTETPKTFHEPTTPLYKTSLQSDSPTHIYQQYGGGYESQGGDNFPSASSHNLTEVQQQQLDNLKSWIQELYTTTEVPIFNTYSTTQTPPTLETDYLTERSPDTTVQFIASLQTTDTYSAQNGRFGKQETPIEMLDGSQRNVQSAHNVPRPFTRDPNEVSLRLEPVHYEHHNHYFNYNQNTNPNEISSSAELVTPFPLLVVSPAAPTPTSTYSAIDASGQFAGMTPPPQPVFSSPPLPLVTTSVHQIIIPYTTKNRPRPFEPTRASTNAGFSVPHSNAHNNGPFEHWSAQSNSVDIHEQQESKVVSAKLATEAPPNARRTTKYITKILASNLRDLLRREHEVKHKHNSSGFDLSQLQKNIDDWTEQEYTSLSHRPSTPTIRGRSKHIPAEYLTTTTPVPRYSKATRAFEFSSELPASVNNLESLLLERDAKRYELKQINGNHLQDGQEFETTTIPNEITSREAPTTSEHGKYVSASAYVRLMPEILQEPAELWGKAKVTISPQTREKVYVVTPQPLFFPQQVLTTNSTERPIAPKSPRFLVRPTPGNGTFFSKATSTSASGLYRPELFGLMGLSAYVPAKPVEIIDGNSKVPTIATPMPTEPSKPSNFLAKKEQSAGMKSTMSPSPR